jgi:ribosome-binding factor A
MRYAKRRRGSGLPSSVDSAFAEALTGSGFDKNRRQKPDYKALQLCRQVQRMLGLSLAGLGDEILAELIVEDVTPAPNASHLLVHVVVPEHRSIVEVLERLDRATARLRAEVAQAITRKKAPGLSFMPAAPGRVRA